MPSTRKVGIIGIGAAARAAFFPVLSQMPEVEMYALHPRQDRLERLNRQWPLAGTATSLESLLAHGIQTAMVLTPGAAHAEYVIPLLEAGVDVLCEKPMALRLAEAESMADAAARTGRTLMIGVNRRYTPVYLQAKAFVPDVEMVVAQKNKPRGEYRGLISDAIHVVDAMRWLCGGEVASVRSAAQYEDPHHERAVTAQVSFDNGRIGLVVMHRNGGHWMEQVEIYGGGRTAVVSYPDRLRLTAGEEQQVVDMTAKAWGWSQVADECGFRAQLEHFFECADARKPTRSDAADVLKTHLLIDRIYREAGLPGLE